MMKFQFSRQKTGIGKLYTRQSQREKVCDEIKKEDQGAERGYMHNQPHTPSVTGFHFPSTGHSLHIASVTSCTPLCLHLFTSI